MQKIGIGYENYKEFIDQKLYYVDKTFLISDIVQKGGKVTLFTRPRRFGKTLALSMLRTFFECELDRDGNAIDNSRYFEGKKIMEADQKILDMMGQYPVIKLSLKSAKQPDYRTAVLRLRDEILSEFGRHEYLLKSGELETHSRELFASLYAFRHEEDIKTEDELNAEIGRYTTSIKVLSDCLKQHHKKNVIILLDEYDVPLENAYYSGFYD
nr:AAA family ATPase [Lachnospiraceae bacterium]